MHTALVIVIPLMVTALPSAVVQTSLRNTMVPLMALPHLVRSMTGQHTRIQLSTVVTTVSMPNHSPMKLIINKSNGSDNKLKNGIPWHFTDNTFSQAPVVVQNVAEFLAWLCTNGVTDVAPSFLFINPLLNGTEPPAAVSTAATFLPMSQFPHRKFTIPMIARRNLLSASCFHKFGPLKRSTSARLPTGSPTSGVTPTPVLW